MQLNSFSPFSNKNLSFSENISIQPDQINTKSQTKFVDKKLNNISSHPTSSLANSYNYNEEIIKTAKLNCIQMSPLRNQDTNKPNRHLADSSSKSNIMDIEANSNNATAKQNAKSLFLFAQNESYQTPYNTMIPTVNPNYSENSNELFTVPLQKNPSLIK